MEKFKQQLKNDVIFRSLFVVLLSVGLIFIWALVPELPNALDRNFVSGVIVGLIMVELALLARNGAALRSEEAVKALYISTTDERRNAIRAAAGRSGIRCLLLGLTAAMLAAALINKVVALTLLGALLFTAAVIGLTLLVYSKKM